VKDHLVIFDAPYGEQQSRWVIDAAKSKCQIGRNPQTVAVGDALRKANITGATIAGGHGATAKQAEIGPALAAN
jgi:hypothetical protein